MGRFFFFFFASCSFPEEDGECYELCGALDGSRALQLPRADAALVLFLQHCASGKAQLLSAWTED